MSYSLIACWHSMIYHNKMAATGRQIQIDQHRITVFTDDQALIEALATQIHTSLDEKIRLKQRYYLSLAGGTTPRHLYRYLAQDVRFTQQHWQQLEIFFGDERYVPHDSAESNFKMAKEAWLDHVTIPKTQIHPIPTHYQESNECAAEYARSLTTLPMTNGVPCFDLILLGMGDDGHTASLFPGTPVLDETKKWVASVHVARLNSVRITLTYPILNHARKIIVLVTGAGKAETLKRVMHEPSAQFPIQKIQNTNGVDWYLDAAAAAELV